MKEPVKLGIVKQISTSFPRLAGYDFLVINSSMSKKQFVATIIP